MKIEDPNGYIPYCEVVDKALAQDPPNWDFKCDTKYMPMLEHVRHDLGMEYLELIKNEFGDFYRRHKPFLTALCSKNDSLGAPIAEHLEGFGTYSPTNLRYIYHSLLILLHANKSTLNSLDVIEIGGGYGGLAFFIHNLAPLFDIKISSYSFFDLPAPRKLQHTYLEFFNIQTRSLNLTQCKNLKPNSFLISAYSLGEISAGWREKYITKVIQPYVSHGFLVWNYIPWHNFVPDKEVIVERERPASAPCTRYVYIKPTNIPPKWEELSPDDKNKFTMNNTIPKLDLFISDGHLNGENHFYDKKEVDGLIKKALKKQVNYYGSLDKFLYDCLSNFPIKNKRVAILGSVEPWYESICIAYGGYPTTIEHNTISTNDERLKLLTPLEYNKNPTKFDAVFSISSFEHYGLGRYGDNIDPEGDFKAMKDVKKNILKKNGVLFLAVPIGLDKIIWNAHRIYGKKRWKKLTEGFDILYSSGFSHQALEEDTGSAATEQPVVVLRIKS